MKTLVISLFQQVMDPSLVLLQVAERFQMSGHSTDHAGHSCDRLASLQPLTNLHVFIVVASEPIITPQYYPDTVKAIRSL